MKIAVAEIGQETDSFSSGGESPQMCKPSTCHPQGDRACQWCYRSRSSHLLSARRNRSSCPPADHPEPYMSAVPRLDQSFPPHICNNIAPEL